jgi:DNA-3-methyladenine glycosylase II
MWGRRPGFETLLRIVLEQQVSLISARAMFARLKTNIQPFTHEGFIAAGEQSLRSLGVTRQKAHYCVQVAQAFTNGDLRRIGRMSDDEAHSNSSANQRRRPVDGEHLSADGFEAPDIWPDGDVALAAAVGKLHQMTTDLRLLNSRESLTLATLSLGCRKDVVAVLLGGTS